MCINTSNFFTRSHPVWERRGSLTSPALPALPPAPRRRPAAARCQHPRREARCCAGLRAPPRPLGPPPRRGLSLGPTAATAGLRGNLQPSSGFKCVFLFSLLVIFIFDFYGTWGLPGVLIPPGTICGPKTKLETRVEHRK